MTLQELAQAIRDDAVIDTNNLDREATRIPLLYSKWLSILAAETRLLRQCQARHDKVLLARQNYYLGKLPDEAYKEEPLQYKVLKADLPQWLDADDKYIAAKDELGDQTIKVNMIEQCLKEIHQRSFNIKNSIDFQRFQAGG